LSGVRAKAKPLTKPGEIFGSPLYMSPEQCTGNSLDQRSDIYSLGCVMYEMLVGKPPFIGETVLATIYMHVNEPAARISESAVKAATPDELENIIGRMLHKNPDLRFQSANELLTELQTFGRKFTETAQMHQTLSKLSSAAFWWSKPAILAVLALSLAAAVWVFLSLGKLNTTIDSEVSNPSMHTHAGLKKTPVNRRAR
jgi:serine/threonine protein kinase